ATPLWIASQNGSAAMVAKLLAAGANPNAALIAGETPLMVAARSGKPEVVERLLAKGANVSARGARGQDALMWAVAQKHPDVVQVLVAHGADVQARSDVWSEMMAVPPHGLPEYNRLIPHGGETPVMFAGRDAVLARGPVQRTERHASAGEARRRSALRAPRRVFRGRGRDPAQPRDQRGDGRDRHGWRSAVDSTRPRRARSADARRGDVRGG